MEFQLSWWCCESAALNMPANLENSTVATVLEKVSFNCNPKECYACYSKSFQLCPTLCDPIDGSLPGSPIPGILQARTLEWVAISFSNAWKWKVKVKSLSLVWLFVTPWTAAYQTPPSMGFSRQEYWSGVPLPSPIPKKGNAKECSNYHTIALISHTSKVMLKILQARL